MRDDVRRKLLADYAVALVTERESWDHLRHSQLSDAQRCEMLARWKQTAARLKTLAWQLREASPRALPGGLPVAPDQHGQLRTDAVGKRGEAGLNAKRRGRRFQTLVLVGAMRLAARWRARLKATMTRLDPPWMRCMARAAQRKPRIAVHKAQ